MNKKIFTIILANLILFLFCSCVGRKDVTDKDMQLRDILTTEYELLELRNYFEAKSFINIFQEPSESPKNLLFFSEVNKKFPIEVIRPEGYSAYKVREGGFYYVFWSKLSVGENVKSANDSFVYSTAYLYSSADISAFDSLTPDISTAHDVKMIDPYFDLSLLRSTGVFSYTYLNKESILEVKYERQKESLEYDNLIIKEIKVIPRKDAPSRYGEMIYRSSVIDFER